ncbi:phage terminase small subunit [Streptomyces luteogriseus]|uniref:phage terminase small subunit n=1 Tax=Streptomyces luteogriseus TaxID=68233 RepID=UPI0036C014F6
MPAQRDPSKPFSRAHRGQGRAGALVDLPSSGCTLPVPEMPPGRDWADTDRARWEELWQSPQATMWDDTARGTVALLLVYEAAVLNGSASAWQAQEARYAGEALGLTPRAMVQLGWRIVDDDGEGR